MGSHPKASEDPDVSYSRLRMMAWASLMGMPPLIVLVTSLTDPAGAFQPQPSLSDYYYALPDGGVSRSLLVGFLVVLGSILLAYKGFDGRDDLFHNFGGFFAFGVAFVPMVCDVRVHPYCVPGIFPNLRVHLACALLLFVCAVLVVCYGGGPELKKALTPVTYHKDLLLRLQCIKRLSLGLMAIGGILAPVVHLLFPRVFSFAILVAEYTGFFGFGLYWLRFSRLIEDANSRIVKDNKDKQPMADVEPGLLQSIP